MKTIIRDLVLVVCFGLLLHAFLYYLFPINDVARNIIVPLVQVAILIYLMRR